MARGEAFVTDNRASRIASLMRASRMARASRRAYIGAMPTPRIDPQRTLTAIERQQRQRARYRAYREALHAIVAARSITEARKLALDALAARGVSARDRDGAAAE